MCSAKSQMQDMQSSIRVDKWLWAARFFKSRSLAAEAVNGGRVQLNGNRIKPSKPVHIGAKLLIRRGDYEYDVVVRDISHRRGPASEARKLYKESFESVKKREEHALHLRELRILERGIRSEGKPNKKQRRQIYKLRNE